jgi:DNA-binding NarL/FixJ family response regulator
MEAGEHVVQPLTARQREVLRVIARYWSSYGEAPAALFIARRLGLHHSTVQEHLRVLHEKGWLTSPVPSGLRCPHVR